jgi:hypothetical protein
MLFKFLTVGGKVLLRIQKVTHMWKCGGYMSNTVDD